MYFARAHVPSNTCQHHLLSSVEEVKRPIVCARDLYGFRISSRPHNYRCIYMYVLTVDLFLVLLFFFIRSGIK